MSFKSILKKSLTSGLLQQKLSAPELIVVLLVKPAGLLGKQIREKV